LLTNGASLVYVENCEFLRIFALLTLIKRVLKSTRRAKVQDTNNVYITFKLPYLYLHTTFMNDNYISKCLKMRICERLRFGWGIKASRIQR